MPFLAELLTIILFMISLPTGCKKHFDFELGVRSLTLKAPLNFSIKIYRWKFTLFSWFSPSPAAPVVLELAQGAIPSPPPELRRGKALSPHSLVALSTGRLLPPHSNLSPALSKLNKPFSQGASDCSSHKPGEEGWRYLFTGRHICSCSLCLGESTCHLQNLFSPVLFCIKGLLSWLKPSAWNKYLKRSDFT